MVHHPGRLEREVLGRYFRHSKYSSFQRQLNYFGFRKIAGKGKMSPCSYVNERATGDIRSLLLMKRKNSKEKEREIRLRELQLRQENGVVNGGPEETGSGIKRRLNPGDDIQPATVRPMFTTSASVNNNVVAAVPINNQTQTATTANAVSSITSSVQTDQNLSKRTKLSHEPLVTKSALLPSDGRRYTVAVGKGVRHQLNGYLRANSNGNISSTVSAPSGAPAAQPTSTTSTAVPVQAGAPSYLSHPPARRASAAPAPLRFLDPGELGMSVETSLSQLKSAFAAASGSNAPSNAGGHADGNVAPPAANVSSSSTVVSSNSTELARRVSTNNFGMLSRDNSLINLAMLPTLDGNSSSGGEGSNDFMKSIFSREESIVNLAAAAASANTSPSSGAVVAPMGGAAASGTAEIKPGKEGGDTFDFIDFQP